MAQNPWIKLAIVSVAGIVISLGILWGINQFNGYNRVNAGYNMNLQSIPQGQMQMQASGNTNSMYDYGLQQKRYWMNQMNNIPMQGMQQGQNWMNQMNNMPMQGMQQAQNWMNNGMNMGNMYMQGMPGQNWMNQGMSMMPMGGGMNMMGMPMGSSSSMNGM